MQQETPERTLRGSGPPAISLHNGHPPMTLPEVLHWRIEETPDHIAY